MFDPIELILLLLGFCILPMCLLLYGVCVAVFYARRAKTRELHLRLYGVLATLSVVIWICFYSRSTETAVGEEINSARTGSVVELCSMDGWRGSDVYIYVRDYDMSGNKLISLNFSYPTGTDTERTPSLWWIKDESLLVIQVVGKPGTTAYDFETHKIISSSIAELLLKSQGHHKKSIVLDTLIQNGRRMRNWERVAWGLGWL